jgi:glycosyltransferase involved in cell wall biosynthesis
VDRHVPPRITYWTGVWEPRREALSHEVQTLRVALAPRAPVVSFSPGQRSSLVPSDAVVRLSGRRWLLLRALAAVIERWGNITHVFGSLDDWHLLRSLGRRPLVFTAAIAGLSPHRRLLEKATVVVVETDTLRRAIEDAGVPASRVRLIYPGVDLDQFAPAPPPPQPPFRILFASTPADPGEFEQRGIPLLVELARRRPDVQIVVLRRQWGSADRWTSALTALDPPANFTVETRGARTMSEVYGAAHATACLYADGFGKSCPNSIIESLACGRPVLVSNTSGIAGIVAREQAGVAAARTVDALADAVDRLRREYDRMTGNARRAAEQYFDVRQFLGAYQQLYEELSLPGQPTHDCLDRTVTQPRWSGSQAPPPEAHRRSLRSWRPPVRG